MFIASEARRSAGTWITRTLSNQGRDFGMPVRLGFHRVVFSGSLLGTGKIAR